MDLINAQGMIAQASSLSQEHIAEVVDNNDPKNLCRVRVRITGIYDKISPWVMRVAPNFPGVTYLVPNVGDNIRVWFMCNDISMPIYGMDYVHTDSKLALFRPGTYGFADVWGTSLKIDNHGTVNLKANSVTIDAPNVSTTGNFSNGTGATGVFAAGNKVVEVVDGQVVSITGD